MNLGAVVAGRWYTLGQTDAEPGGYGPVQIGTGHKKGAAGTTDAISGTDFTLDLDTGRVLSHINDPKLQVGVKAPAAAISRRRIDVSSAPSQLTAAVRYIEDAALGKGRDLYAPRCSLQPQGEAALKSRTQEHQLTLLATVLDPGGGVAPLTITGEDVA